MKLKVHLLVLVMNLKIQEIQAQMVPRIMTGIQVMVIQGTIQTEDDNLEEDTTREIVEIEELKHTTRIETLTYMMMMNFLSSQVSTKQLLLS